MSFTTNQLALQARYSAEDAYRRARDAADVCARVIADTLRTHPDAVIPGGFLFRYAQYCEAEQQAHDRMRAAQAAVTS